LAGDDRRLERFEIGLPREPLVDVLVFARSL
jgi:hypothetical protein